MHKSTTDTEVSSFIEFFRMGVKVKSDPEEEAQPDILAVVVLLMSFLGDPLLPGHLSLPAMVIQEL